jgi:tRNA modification GTPase
MRAEAILGMIESTSEPEQLCAQKMYDGKINALISIKEKILNIQSKIEAEIEFGEEEHLGENSETGKEIIRSIIRDIEKEIELREKITNLNNGIRIVIAGPTNAGKSTLFNTILGYQRALVHHEPGTTRDLVSERVLIDGHEIQLIDSAGLRETSCNVEKQGIETAKKAITAANLILWVTAANEALLENEKQEFKALIRGKKAVGIINKIDIGDGVFKAAFFTSEGIPYCSISLKLEKNIDCLVKMVEKECCSITSSIEMPESLLNKRYENIGQKILRDLIKAEQEWNRLEIAAYHVKSALSSFNELFGADNNEEMLNRIFDNFCIGK